MKTNDLIYIDLGILFGVVGSMHRKEMGGLG
jgi:hypothetical protein